MANLWARGKRIWTAFETHQGSLMAAAVAFYGLLSVIPLLSLGVAVVAVVAGSSRLALETLQSITAQLLPGEQELVYNTVRELRHGSGLVGIIGLGGLLISSSAVFTTLEDALNGMWHVPNRRAWWKQKLVAAGTAALTIFLMICSLGITSALSWVKSQAIPGVDVKVADIPFLWQLVGAAVPLLLTIITFTFIYVLVPNRRVSFKNALLGGLLTGTAWELAKYLFAFYLVRFSQYSKVYGSLGAIVSLMIWAYYSSTILLLGGEVVADLPDDRVAKSVQSGP